MIRPVLEDLKVRAEQVRSLTGDYEFYRLFLRHRIGGLFLKNLFQNRGSKILLAGATGKRRETEKLLFAMPLLAYDFQITMLGCLMPYNGIPIAFAKSNAESLIMYVDKHEAFEDKCIDLFQTVVSSINAPIFISGEFDKNKKQRLEEIGLIILPKTSVEQATLIKQNLTTNLK